MRKLFLMCQTTGPAETRFLADPLAFWQTHCRCSFAHACGKNGEQWTISRSQGPVMDGCLPDPDKKYPLRSDGPANFAFSVYYNRERKRTRQTDRERKREREGGERAREREINHKHTSTCSSVMSIYFPRAPCMCISIICDSVVALVYICTVCL